MMFFRSGGRISQNYAVILVVIITNKAYSYSSSENGCECDEAFISRRGFPEGFVFGSASSSYQVEGGYDLNGKAPSTWDYFTHTYPQKIRDGTNGDVAVDSYHLYKDDVQLLKNMGVDAYKFSISWSRILPGGGLSHGVNQDGIDYYNNLINDLIANGIEPWVTMLHLDSPQALEDEYGGFLSSQIVGHFEELAYVLFSHFGDRVKNWITINEPWCLSYLGYTIGVFAPSRCSTWEGDDCAGGDSAVEPYIVTHNQLLAHARAVKLYRDKYQKVQKGQIGITVNTYWFEPYDNTPENVKAKDRAMDFMLGWIMDPITFGQYPESMRSGAGDRLPRFTEEEKEMVKGSFDFIGLNYYSANYALNIPLNTTHRSFRTDSAALVTGVRDGVPIGEQYSTNSSRYYAYPKGLRLLLGHLKQEYNDPLIYITENGLDLDRNNSLPMAEAIKDYERKEYIYEHLCCLRAAIEEDGMDKVKGYFVWSLTDNFEWASGYLVSFGLHHVDFNDEFFTRYPKYSARWIAHILSQSRISVD